ncbi:MAG TPA: hypothetical protein VNB06_03020 [Thermoanaerobaculia bacterium]|nr:hypothetical protein [Thermoanaerobaculia bacterium]
MATPDRTAAAPSQAGTLGAPERAALRLLVDSSRWEGVPFYVRAGKCLVARAGKEPDAGRQEQTRA